MSLTLNFVSRGRRGGFIFSCCGGLLLKSTHATRRRKSINHSSLGDQLRKKDLLRGYSAYLTNTEKGVLTFSSFSVRAFFVAEPEKKCLIDTWFESLRLFIPTSCYTEYCFPHQKATTRICDIRTKLVTHLYSKGEKKSSENTSLLHVEREICAVNDHDESVEGEFLRLPSVHAQACSHRSIPH